MKVRFGQVLFSGASGAGKSNFCNLLLKKAFRSQHVSTGLHESERVSAMKIKMQHSDEQITFKILDIKREIDELQSRLHTLTEPSQPSEPLKGNSIEELPSPFQSELESAKQEDVYDMEQSTHYNEDYDEDNADLSSKYGVLRVLQIADDPTSSTNHDKEDTWNILTFLDTGGQPQFINMLPAVNSFTMITFIVHKMTDSLSSPVDVTYHGEQPFTSYSIGCTYLELIKSLISFTSSKVLEKKTEKICNEENIIKRKNTSYVSFVGTHFDKIPEGDVKLLGEIDRDLTLIVSDFQVRVLMNIHKDYKYLIPVNNTTANTDDEDQSAVLIRNKLYDVLCEQNTYHVPIVWIILELEIRYLCKERHNHAISYAEVVKLCREKKLLEKESDIKNGLRFHHLFGTLLYFEEVKEMNDIIFTDIQWLFDKMTDLVKLSYHISDNEDIEEFEHKGIFSPGLLDKIDFSIGCIEFESKNFKMSFLKLLEHLRIIAHIHKSNDSKERYFMPCLLKNCNVNYCKGLNTFLEDYGSQKTNGNTEVSPLLIQIISSSASSQKSNSVPRGVFCCLVVELLQDVSKWKLVWSISKVEVFDNLVTLIHLETSHKVTLIDRLLFLEVQIRQEDTTLPSIHFQIKQTIKNTLMKVCNRLSFCEFELSFGFLCSKCKGGETHMTKFSTHCKQTLMCRFNKTLAANGSHMVWFEEVRTVLDII